MDSINKSKLSERVKKHIAAQTPSTNGEDDYDASGQINAEGCEACKEMKAVYEKHYGKHAESE